MMIDIPRRSVAIDRGKGFSPWPPARPETLEQRFAWRESYSVGHPLMDRQHRRLLALSIELLRCADDPGRALRNLDSLCARAREHFRAEQHLMQEHGFPGYVAHRAMHDRIMDRFLTLSAEIRSDPGAVDQMEEFLETWVLHHFVIEDRALGTFLRR